MIQNEPLVVCAICGAPVSDVSITSLKNSRIKEIFEHADGSKHEAIYEVRI